MAEGGSQDGQEKSFEATEAKIRRTREEGDVPQSTELNTLALYCGFAVIIAFMGKTVFAGMMNALSKFLAYPDDIGALLTTPGTASQSIWLFRAVPLVLLPVLGTLILFVLASLMAQRSIVFSGKKIQPKLSRISPLSNAKQKYGPQGMAEFAKRLAKLILITVIAIIFLSGVVARLPYSSTIDPRGIAPALGDEALKLTFYMIGALALIVAVDLPYVILSYYKKLRMTLQEMRDEMKQSEGDPHMKAERRSRAMELSRMNMLRDVQTADVIIVNPTHYSVALKWDGQKGTVPVCVAKGTDHLALSIRERAKEFDIPIYSDPPCARSVHALVEVGEPIKPQHYAAVAASIHFANQIRKRKKAGL